ncbi:MAG TPA: efflux RND transporter periplasmic adaptor subunit [Flavobacteriales bacterium]|nr:efflux RND transporter periplasmic adaptor subunit [Flavobacteriales bacterium]HPQ58943.1 efflux RND transporter periplasmic adaptor subunit [Flavobacteriales bacterium]
MKRILRTSILILLGILFVWTLWYLYQKSAEKPVAFVTEKPEQRDIVKKTVANGSVVPRQEILIKPQVSGIIKEIYVEAGDTVAKDQVLAKIQIIPDMVGLTNAENRVRRARIGVEDAQRTFDRNKPLLDKGVISDAEFQTYQIALENAQEELRGAEDNLDIVREGVARSSSGATLTLVRSTINGMVLDVPVKEGNSVIEANNFNEGTTIASVADMNDLIFEGKLDESEVGKVRLGMPIVLTIGAIDDATWEAELEYIAPKGVEEEGAIQFEIRAAVKLDEGQRLRAGYSANADIVLDQRDSVLSIPESVITFNKAGDSAFVDVRQGEGWEKTYVRTGLSDGIHIEVLDGIGADTELKGAKKMEGEGGGPKGRRG